MNFLENLTILKRNEVYSIQDINGWLLEFEEDYKRIYDKVQKLYRAVDENGLSIRLPPFGKSSEDDVFLNLYEELKIISNFHENEKQMKTILEEYNNVKDSDIGVSAWLQRNEGIVERKCFHFLVTYLWSNELNDYPMVDFHTISNFYFYLDSRDFANTIKLGEIYNELILE